MEPVWDDLRLVLAIVENGGLTGAAKKLGVHYATVLRRLDSFEYRTGTILFDRKKTGYQPTAAGEALATEIRAITTNVDDTYRLLAGEDLRLSGHLRIASSDFISQQLLPEVLTCFSKKHPDVKLELAISANFASLTKRDADVAIRMSSDIPADLSGHALAELAFGIYAHRDVVAEGKIDAHTPWIADEETLVASSVNKWQREFQKEAKNVLWVNSTMTRYSAIKHNLGIGFLPHLLAKPDKELVCVQNSDNWKLTIWFLSHVDLSNMKRLQEFKAVTQSVIKRRVDTSSVRV